MSAAAAKTANHPDGHHKIIFEPIEHLYLDGDTRAADYISVTALVQSAFDEFDASAAAVRVAQREGSTPAEVLATWRRKGSLACALGSRVHEMAESVLLGEPITVAPESDRERGIMASAWTACQAIIEHHDIIACELIVFSPRYKIAGQIDAALRDRRDGTIRIVDWKTNENLHKGAYNGKTALEPIADLPDTKLARYGLQLSIYEAILRDEGYIKSSDQVERHIIHLREDGSEMIRVGYRRREVIELILRHITKIPF